MTMRHKPTEGASVLIDSSVMIPALGDRPDDPWSNDCTECLKLLIRNRYRILVAAPTLAEIMRFGGGSLPPRTEGIEVVAFDQEAAKLLGKCLEINQIRQMRDELGGPLDYYKYDAIIAACAKRHRAVWFVGRDKGQRKMAEKFDLTFLPPEEVVALLSPQPTLPGVDAAPGGSTH